jgi:hypothetical protein
MLTWFRLHHEARNDAKLRHLTDAQFRVWFNLLCYASEQPERGTIASDEDQLLALEVSGGDVELMNDTIAKLQSLRIVSSETGVKHETQMKRFHGVSCRFIVFHAFAKRQGRGVSRNAKTSTDRVRKYREARKLQRDETVKRDETPQKRGETRETPQTRLDKTREETHTPRADVYVSVNGSEPEPFEAPRPPTGLPGNPCDLSDAERAELHTAGAKAERLFPMAEFGAMISREPRPLDRMDVSWWSPALDRLAARPKGQRTWAYLLGILRGFHDDGGPPAPSPRGDANGHGSAKAERSKRQDDAFANALAEIPEEL